MASKYPPRQAKLYLEALGAGFSQADAREWARREYRARYTPKDRREELLDYLSEKRRKRFGKRRES
jgi:hypothetical protein